MIKCRIIAAVAIFKNKTVVENKINKKQNTQNIFLFNSTLHSVITLVLM